MSYEPNAKVRYYQVKCWEPPRSEKGWGRHVDYGVVAQSATAALAIINAQHPQCRIDAVNERGVVHHVIDLPDIHGNELP